MYPIVLRDDALGRGKLVVSFFSLVGTSTFAKLFLIIAAEDEKSGRTEASECIGLGLPRCVAISMWYYNIGKMGVGWGNEDPQKIVGVFLNECTKLF